MSVLLLIVMCCYSPQLTLLCLAAVALYAAGRWLAHAPLRDARHEQIAGAAKQDSHFLETVRGIRAIRLFQRGDERRADWLALLVEQVNAGLRAQKLGIALRCANGRAVRHRERSRDLPGRARSCSTAASRPECCWHSSPTDGSSHYASAR